MVDKQEVGTWLSCRQSAQVTTLRLGTGSRPASTNVSAPEDGLSECRLTKTEGSVNWRRPHSPELTSGSLLVCRQFSTNRVKFRVGSYAKPATDRWALPLLTLRVRHTWDHESPSRRSANTWSAST